MCYTVAWGEAVAFAVLNIVGLIVAIATGTWMLKRSTTTPTSAGRVGCGARRTGLLPRVKPSTAGEGHERRYFYGTVWAFAVAQSVVWILYLLLPRTTLWDSVKLAVFLGILLAMGRLAYLGRLPRTRPIVPGEWASLD